MGYACPVCDDPQADARHLANHLAFTAIARGGDHEAWLDEHVPDWGERDEESLGERVTEHAAETEFPQVFDDTTEGVGSDHSHGHGHRHGQEHERRHGEGHGRGHDPTAGDGHPRLDDARSRAADGRFTDDASDVLAKARELTRRRRENAADGDPSPADESETGDGGNADETGSGGESDDSETE